jgi:hypothetical protein
MKDKSEAWKAISTALDKPISELKKRWGEIRPAQEQGKNQQNKAGGEAKKLENQKAGAQQPSSSQTQVQQPASLHV